MPSSPPVLFWKHQEHANQLLVACLSSLKTQTVHWLPFEWLKLVISLQNTESIERQFPNGVKVCKNRQKICPTQQPTMSSPPCGKPWPLTRSFAPLKKHEKALFSATSNATTPGGSDIEISFEEPASGIPTSFQHPQSET